MLERVDLSTLPAFEPNADAVYFRGVALVEAVAAVRGSGVPGPRDEVTDPWGAGRAVFGEVADGIEAKVRGLARALLA